MLYRPSGADNPGSFDFRRYLAKQGAFAGFSARSVEVVDTRIHWGIWHWRHRIVSSFVQGLGERRGELLGALVLGARASQMDFDLQDTFRAVGLSHLMAASGFQVSVLLAVALAAMRTWQKSVRQAIALAVLLAYAGLTGGGPSILRATMMGSVAIVALEDGLGGKRLRPLGLLLLTAVLLLLAQPLWIDDLGFQLSFLATLGLLVAAKPWQQHLEFLPPAMAAAVAIPLAALLWTLPLQLSAFGKIAPYSLVADLCITPLAIAAIVAGFGVSAFALLMPSVGAVLAWPLRVLLDPLLGFAAWIASWPHAQSYVGALPRWQCVALYVLLAIATFGPQLSILPQRWIGKLHNRLAIGVSGTFIVAVLLPALWPAPLVQIVALAAREPVLVVHSQGGTAIVNSGSDETVAQVVLPYLRHAGIHRIHKALALADGAANSGWDVLVANIAVEQFWSEDRFEISSEAAAVVETLRESGTVLHSLGREPSLQMGSVTWQSVEPNVLKMSLPGYQWLLLGAPVTSTSHLPQLGLLPPVQWVWWDGSLLPPDLLGELDTQGGMVGGDRLVPTNETQFAAAEVPLYWTERVGAVQWTPSGARLNQPDLS
jgi:competence protein ComEC